MSRTPSQTVGPYYEIGLCRRPDNELAPRTDRDALQLIGRLLDGEGVAVADGMIEIWDGSRWGRSGTDSEGRFSFAVTKPAARPGETPRFDVYVFARGLLRQQLTRIYFPDEPNETDPVFAALPDADRETLVAQREDGALHFDIRMQGQGATVFFAH
jgi:protocatechuate 3,4-dioxygenase, alpha subunit